MRKIHLLILILAGMLYSCENGDWDFPDFEYQTVYFSYQSPVRTITLGEDIFDTSLDNNYQCMILATMGGAYNNTSEIVIDYRVDNTLCDNLYFDRGGNTDAPVLPMPADYYSLSADQMVIEKGQETGGIVVQLTEAFFTDPLALSANYVIPIVLEEAQNVDSILAGKPLVDHPIRTVPEDWEVNPKDYILYAIQYVNPWHGNYLRRGEDVITGKDGYGDLDATVTRQQEFVEKDEVKLVKTASLNTVILDLTFQDLDGTNIPCSLVLTFDEQGQCTISSGTDGITATGSGSFVSKGEKNSWGSKDRDALYLTYEIDMPQMQVVTTDTLVLRDRGVGMELFSTVYKAN